MKWIFFPFLRIRRVSLKIWMTLIPLLAGISLLIFTLAPSEHKKQSLAAIAEKAQGIADMAAYSLGPALYFSDVETVQEILLSVRQNKDVVYLVVSGESGKLIASHNLEAAGRVSELPSPEASISEDGLIYHLAIPVNYKERKIGNLAIGFSLSQLQEKLAQYRESIALISLVIFIIGTILIVGVSTIVTTPLRRMADTARRIADGDLKQRAHMDIEDEVGKLAQSFNIMIDHLEEARFGLEKKVEERTQELQKEILERKRAEEALRESEELFREMVESLGEGISIADPEEKFIFSNPASDIIFGFPRGGLVGHTLKELTSPGQFADIQEQTKRRRVGERGSYEIEITKPDGKKRTLLVTASSRFDEGGRYIGSLGVFTDITERKKSEEAVREANLKLQNTVQELERHNAEMLLLSELYDSFQTCRSEEDIFTFTSRFAERLFPDSLGLIYLYKTSQSFLEATSFWGNISDEKKILAPDDCWSLRQSRPYIVENAKGKLICPHVEGKGEAFLPYFCIPLTAQGKTIGLLHIKNNTLKGADTIRVPGPEERRAFQSRFRLAIHFSERVALALSNFRLSEILRQQSIRDPLTGLYNRRYMEETLEREISRAARSGSSVGIVMLDIDHFKEFNDSLGHEAGDVMLKALGTYLMAQVRREDIVCRYGGEEFLIILPGSRLEVAKQRAGKLRENISLLKPQYGNKTLGPITLSFGLALFPSDGKTAERIVHAADEALLRAKRTGRNRIVVYGE
jgi:diguanylate cyclase (GGDEF)-like protein/PAS domain S-box-containing protein